MDNKSRIALEKRIVRYALTAAHDAGWKVHAVDDGGELVKANSIEDAINTIFSVDTSIVKFRNAELKSASLQIVLGNTYDVLVDYSFSPNTKSFADAMTKAENYVNALQANQSFNKNPRKRLSQAEMLKNPSDILSGKSIQTEYFGPGNVRGARIKASVIDGNKVQASMSISYPHELDMYAAHIYAAEKIRDKMGWTGDLIGVATKKGYVFGFEKFKTSRFGFQRNPTLRATRTPNAARRHAAMFDTDKQSSERKHIYVQRKEGAMWITLAVALHTKDGIAKARTWADRFHRKHPGSTLRIFV